MRHPFSKAFLPSSVLGIVLSLGIQAHAATLFPGTQLLSDTPEFLDFKFNLYSLPVNFCNIFGPPPSCGSLPTTPSPEYSLLLGQSWNISARVGQGDLFGRDVTLFVEQVTQKPNPTLPRATFITSDNRGFLSPFPSQQVSYLTNDPPQVFSAITCSFGSPNCVTYELGSLSFRTTDPEIGFIPPIFELKGFFNPQQVPEPETGIGALAALGLMMMARFRKGFFKANPKSLS
jgi:hypothetical protein